MWRTALRTMQNPLRSRSGFQPCPVPDRFTVQKWWKAVNLNHMPLKAPTVFEAGPAPWLGHLPDVGRG